MTHSDHRLLLFGGYPGARYLGTEEERMIAAVIKARSPYRYYGINPLHCCDRLEHALGRLFSRRRVLCVSSGTAALHAALFAVGVRPGDEVVLPAYAWSADLMAILALGAVPVIAPIDRSLGLDAAALGACCSRRTRAVLAVHMRGAPCDIVAVRRVTRRMGLVLIEDCAQCLGGRVGGKPVGTFGELAVFSFQYNKLITSGEGGALATDSRRFFERAKRFHDLGMMREVGMADPRGPRAIGCFGLNHRLSELQAAALLAQIGKIPAILKDLRRVHAAARRALRAEIEEYDLVPRARAPGAEPNGAFIGLQSRSGDCMETAVAALRGRGLPAQWCGTMDPHHFICWKAFMERERIKYRLVRPEQSAAYLRSSLFLELNPLAPRSSP